MSRWLGVVVLSGFLVLALAGAEAGRGQQADSRLLFRYVGSVCLLLGIGLISLAAGLRFLHPQQPSILLLSLAFLAGYGLYGMLVFVTGVLHLLYPSVLAAELFCIGLALRKHLNQVFAVLGEFPHRFRSFSITVRVTVIAIAAYSGFLLVVALGPVSAWDAVQSHWAIARFFARHHATVFPFFDGNGGTPHLMRMIYTAFTVFTFDHQASLAVWVLFPVLMGLVCGVARRLSASQGSVALMAALFILLVSWPMFLTQPQLDSPVLVFGLGAVIAAIFPAFSSEKASHLGGDHEPTPIPFPLSGVLAGFALGIKWHALPLVAPVLASYWLFWRPIMARPMRGRALRRWALSITMPAAAFAIYDWAWTGNPLRHPMVPLIGDPNYWSGVASTVSLWHEHLQVVRTKLYPSVFVHPLDSVRYIISSYILVLPGLLLAATAWFVAPGRVRRVVVLLSCGGALFILALTGIVSADYRHLLTGMGMLLLPAGIGWEMLIRSRFRLVCWVLPAIVVAGVAQKAADGRFAILEQYAEGFTSVVQGPYFSPTYQATFAYPAIRWANENLPVDAKVVADFRRMGNLERDWMTIHPAAQCIVEVRPNLPADSLRAALLHLGITHLWVDERGEWKDSALFPSAPRYLAPWRELVRREQWLEPVYADSVVRIFRLKRIE